jgi:C4-type Zn-finger protein
MDDERKKLVLRCWVCGKNFDVFEGDIFYIDVATLYHANCKHCGYTHRVLLDDAEKLFGKITPTHKEGSKFFP